MRFALVCTGPTSALAAASVRHALAVVPTASVTVLDVDGSYSAMAGENVVAPTAVGVSMRTLHEKALLLGRAELARWLYPSMIRTLAGPEPVVAMLPGVILLRPPDDLVGACANGGLAAVPRVSGIRDDGRWPGPQDALRLGDHDPVLLAVNPGDRDALQWWAQLTDHPVEPGDRWLDWVLSRTRSNPVPEDARLISPWTLAPERRIESGSDGGLLLDGREVIAVDLSHLDPTRPWLLDATVPGDPRARLSDHPVLAAFVAGVASELSTGDAADRSTWDPEMTAVGVPVSPVLRSLYRATYAERARTPGAAPPDPFDPDQVDRCRHWLTEPLADGPGRYLRAIYDSRPDLPRQFPHVPGEHTAAFLRWAGTHAAREVEDATGLVDESVERAVAAAASGRRRASASGVNVVGFLSGELGIGESARLMVDALQSAGVPHATVVVRQGLISRASADVPAGRGAARFDTTLLCINADLVGAVAATLPAPAREGYRIGMWYWEVADFPAEQHGGFAHVDEIWVATDFIRQAVEPHSPVPVHTVTPPLPQRGPAPTLTRGNLGLPEGPLFLFSFDFLSTAERKNPLGLIDAFTSAFAPGEGPTLVIKSINAGRRPAEAERLRLRAAAEPDVVLMEDYLDSAEHNALMALCDCYVSLHRSEGLGLTMAEAMAWGKPVIATGYGGNLQFMTEQNSFLVPWAPTPIPVGAEPYPAGGVWADPDLHAAAQMMRAVVEHPEVAVAVGAMAAADLATLHSPTVAGRLISARLARSATRRRARSTRILARRLRASARAAKAKFA